MRKTFPLFIVILFTILFSCSQNFRNNEDLILNFGIKVIQNKDYKKEDVSKYLNIYFKNIDDKNKILNQINGWIEAVHDQAKYLELPYENPEVIPYSEVEKFPKLKMNKLYSQLSYKNLENVYYLSFNDKEEVFLIVTDGKKIISLYIELHQGTERVIPQLLNKKN